MYPHGQIKATVNQNVNEFIEIRNQLQQYPSYRLLINITNFDVLYTCFKEESNLSSAALEFNTLGDHNPKVNCISTPNQNYCKGSQVYQREVLSCALQGMIPRCLKKFVICETANYDK